MSDEIRAEKLAALNEQIAAWRQGDIATPGVTISVAEGSLPLAMLSRQHAKNADTPLFVAEEAVDQLVVLTQTCDLVRSVTDDDPGARFWVQVAPVVALSDQDASLARKNRITRFAPIPGVSDNRFADLDRCSTVEKSVLSILSRIDNEPDDQERIAFGDALARHRGRFAFPDDLEVSLNPFKRLMGKRAGKDSPEGRCLDAVAQIRAEADPSWLAEKVRVTVYFIIEVDALPAGDDEEPLSEDEIGTITSAHDPKEIAARIDDAGPSEILRRHALWSRLAEVWVQDCEPSGTIESICTLVESEADFSLLRMRSAPLIDFDHLSPEDDSVR